jgi:xanthine dehydrogenase accessory factor
MLFRDHIVLVRGGGDLGTGVVYQLHQAGFPVVVLEIDRPEAIRRKVALAAAVGDGEILVEGLVGVALSSIEQAMGAARGGVIPVVVSPELPTLDPPADVVVDARLAKRNIDTTTEDASLVVALGPGFVAGADCHAVIETKRGHSLGRVIWDGSAMPNTATPGLVGGESSDRVLHSPLEGTVSWDVSIGDLVVTGQELGSVGGAPVVSRLNGAVRGLISQGFPATNRLKIADIDPRGDPAACFEISDKARLVGAGVLEAVLVWRNGLLEE